MLAIKYLHDTLGSGLETGILLIDTEFGYYGNEVFRSVPYLRGLHMYYFHSFDEIPHLEAWNSLCRLLPL